jgi:hypothetical protein
MFRFPAALVINCCGILQSPSRYDDWAGVGMHMAAAVAQGGWRNARRRQWLIRQHAMLGGNYAGQHENIWMNKILRELPWLLGMKV